MKIYNYSLENVRLLSRKWMIRQFDGSLETVEGDGVVGEQPHMEPGESHVYTSYCLLTGEHGSMWGFYFGKDDNEIPVIWRIPRFDMSIEGNGSA
jgi:ApaG protein